MVKDGDTSRGTRYEFRIDVSNVCTEVRKAHLADRMRQTNI